MSWLNNATGRTLLIILIGGLQLYTFISAIDDSFMDWDFILLAPLSLLFIVVATWCFIKDRKQYRATQSYLSYSASIAGVMMFVVLFITQQILANRDSSPVLIQAGYDGGFNGAWFEFRKDGTYKFVNSGGIGATTLRGNYQLQDSIIILDSAHLDNTLNSKLLAIRIITDAERLHGETPVHILYQINEQYQIIDKELAFIIHEDHRQLQKR